MVVRPRGVSSHSPLVADQGNGTSRLGRLRLTTSGKHAKHRPFLIVAVKK
jgi:hypothetical protein